MVNHVFLLLFSVIIMNYCLSAVITIRNNSPPLHHRGKQLRLLSRIQRIVPPYSPSSSSSYDQYNYNTNRTQYGRQRNPHNQRQLNQMNRNIKMNADYVRNIMFKMYNKYGDVEYEDTLMNNKFLADNLHENSNSNKKFAIILHGWRESCNQRWINELIQKLIKYRGGTIICMDYHYYSASDSYFRLVKHFNGIVNVLTEFLFQLEQINFDMNNGYMFGFSFGGQLACEAGRRIGFKKIKEIDTCDMAGPGFDNRGKVEHTSSAQNVQCIHTSRDKGTRNYNSCHQDWRIGNCGFTQDAASDPPFGSHGLCPYMYVNAFDNEFIAIHKPQQCKARNPVLNLPENYRMGYQEHRKSQVYGELFALTSKQYPYNDFYYTRNPSNLNVVYKDEYEDDPEFDYNDDTSTMYNATIFDDYS